MHTSTRVHLTDKLSSRWGQTVYDDFGLIIRSYKLSYENFMLDNFEALEDF